MKPAQCVSTSCWLSHRAEEQWGDRKWRWRHMTEKLCKQDTHKDACLQAPARARTHSGGSSPACLFLLLSYSYCRCGTLCQIVCPVPCLCLSAVLCSALQELLDVSLLWSRGGWVKGWLGLTVGIWLVSWDSAKPLTPTVPAVLEEAANCWLLGESWLCVVGHGRSVGVFLCLCLRLITYSIKCIKRMQSTACKKELCMAKCVVQNLLMPCSCKIKT